MKSLSDSFTGTIMSICRRFIFAALIFLAALNLRADAPPTKLNLRYTGKDFEGRQTFQLEWDAISNATYRIQRSGSIAPGVPWETVDLVTPVGGTGQREIKGRSIPENSVEFFRLVLPQPEIFSVEPAMLAPGVAVDLYVVGQCFGSNDVLRINGEPQTNAVFHSSTLLSRPSFTPATPGTYVFELVVASVVRASFNVTCADAFANPELVLQGPPELPPASPASLRKYKTKSNQSNDRVIGGGIRENDNVVFEIQEGKKGLNAVNVKLARVAGGGAQPFSLEKVQGKVQQQGTSEANRVIPFSGEVSQQVVDLAVEGRGLAFIWARTYNSRIGRTGASVNGWTFSYDLNIQPFGGDIVIHDGTGRTDTFKLQTNGVYTCREFFREGTVSNDTFTLTFADGGRFIFYPFRFGEQGKLTQIIDRNGNTMSLNYDGSGLLSQIVDDLDRTNTVAYDLAGRVASVTDFSGRVVRYEYDGNGDLVACVSPPVTGTPNGNDFPGGKTNRYTYSAGYLDDRENHLLLSVIDASGQTTQQHVYQHNQTDFDFLRCISIQRWTNTPAILTYLPQTPAPSNHFAVLRCVMNDPVGNVTECFYDARNRLVKLQEFTGRATPGVPVTATVNRPAGKVRSNDPDYFECRAEWNNDSLCTLEVAPGGQQVECVYESDFDKSTRARKRADCRVVRERATGGVDLDGDGTLDLTQRASFFTYDPRFGSDPTASSGKWMRELHVKTKGTRTAAGLAAVKGKLNYLPDEFADFIISATDPRGNVTTGSYDTNGNLTRCTGPFIVGNDAPKVDCAYDSYGQLIAITNAPDANGRRRVDQYIRNYGFVVVCRVDTGPGGLNLTNKFDRDALDNVTRYEDARGNDWLYTYNALDQCVRVQTPTNITARGTTDFFYDENDNLFTVSGTVRDQFDNPVLDQVNRFRHDPLHRLTRAEWAVDASHSMTNDFVYNGNDQCVLVRGGNAVSGADPHRTVSFQYDERGLLFREIGAPGSADQSTTQWDYDSNGNLTRVSKGLEGTPQVTTIEYDGFAGFGSSSDQIGRGEIEELHADLFIDTCSDQIAGGGVAGFGEVEYSLMRAQGSTPLAGSLRTTRISKITDALGNQTTFNFDANDNLKVIRRFGQTNDVPGTNGNLRLAESRYEYDALDRCVRFRDAYFDVNTQLSIGDGERTTTFAYAPNDQCTNVTDDLGRATTYTYNTVGWPASVSSPGGKTVYLQLRDQAGNVFVDIQTDLPDLGGPAQVFSRTNVFDSLNRLVSTTDNVGNTNHYAYDSLSRVVKQTGPRGIQSFYEYDLLGRQTLAVRDLDGDGLPSSNDRTFSAYWVDPDPRWPGIITDSHGNTTSYGYDSLGRCTSVTNADGTRNSFVWNSLSDLVREEDANGTVILHAYDLNSRCISNNITPGAGVSPATTVETFAYDGLARLVSASNDGSDSTFAYDSLGNRTRDVSGGLGALTTFDSVGNRLSLTYPGGRALTYAYDALDRCTNIVESSSSLASFSYDGPGRVARVLYGNGTRTDITNDGLAGVPNASGDFGHGQISSVTHAAAGGSPKIVAVDLKWDRNGNKTLRTDTIFAPAIPRTNDMGLEYDAADRLTRASVISGPALLRDTIYGLDRMGNRTNVAGAGCSGSYTMDLLSPPADFQRNQYTASPCELFSYDDNGNLTNRASVAGPVTYEYDYASRLVRVMGLDSGSGSIEPLASYTYDALGRRVSKTLYSGGVATGTNQFFYDGGSLIEARLNGTLIDSMVNMVDDRYLLGLRHYGQDYFLHTDDQGNTLALTTTNGAVVERYDYDDYGQPQFLGADGTPLVGGDGMPATASAAGNPFLFHGMEWDSETGLYLASKRFGMGGETAPECPLGVYFDPQTGRAVRGKVKTVRNTGNGRGLAGNNPWTGDSPSAMEKGKVKFFNDAKGFGRVAGGGGGGGGGCGGFAIETRDILKSFFETGDKPTQAQFSTLIDSTVNLVDDRYLLGLRGPGGGRVWPRGGLERKFSEYTPTGLITGIVRQD